MFCGKKKNEIFKKYPKYIWNNKNTSSEKLKIGFYVFSSFGHCRLDFIYMLINRNN